MGPFSRAAPCFVSFTTADQQRFLVQSQVATPFRLQRVEVLPVLRIDDGYVVFMKCLADALLLALHQPFELVHLRRFVREQVAVLQDAHLPHRGVSLRERSIPTRATAVISFSAAHLSPCGKGRRRRRQR
jgi:hypothetical protein